MPGTATLVMTTKEAAAVRGLLNVVRAEERVERGANKIGDAARRAGRAGEQMGRQIGAAAQRSNSFTRRAVGSLTAYAGGFLSVHAAIRTTISLLQELAQVREASAEKQTEAYKDLGSLAQLVQGPRKDEELEALLQAARDIYAQGATDTLGEAGRLVFALQSASSLHARQLYTDLASYGIVPDPAELAKSARTLQSALGERVAGTHRDIVSGAFAASRFSPSRVEELLEAAARSGSRASVMGLSLPEVLAATTVVSEPKGSADVAGTYVAQLMRTLATKEELKGLTLPQMLMKIQQMQLSKEDFHKWFDNTRLSQEELIRLRRAEQRERRGEKGALSAEERAIAAEKGWTGEEIKKWFGRAQGQEAYDLLVANLSKMLHIMESIKDAQKRDVVQERIEAVQREKSGMLMGIRSRRIEKARRELSEEELGIWYNRAEAIIDATIRKGREEGRSQTYLWFQEKALRSTRTMEGDEEFVRFRTTLVPAWKLQRTPEQQREEFQRINEARKVAGLAPLTEADFQESLLPPEGRRQSSADRAPAPSPDDSADLRTALSPRRIPSPNLRRTTSPEESPREAIAAMREPRTPSPPIERMRAGEEPPAWPVTSPPNLQREQLAATQDTNRLLTELTEVRQNQQIRAIEEVNDSLQQLGQNIAAMRVQIQPQESPVVGGIA